MIRPAAALAELLSDVRLSLRTVRTRPRFALLAVALYAVAIGSNTAVFTVLDGVLLEPLPFADAEDVVAVWERHSERGLTDVPAAPAKLLEWEARSDLFAGVASHRDVSMDFEGPAGPERLRIGLVHGDYLGVLGVEPILGRGPTTGERAGTGERVVLVSHVMWSTRLGATPDVPGRVLTLDGVSHVVIGVLPPRGVHPDGLDALVPLPIDNPSSRVAHGHSVIARLADGAAVDDVRRELAAVAARNAIEHADTDAGWDVRVVPLRDQIVGDLRRSLLLLQGAVGLVLLVACANVAGLLLVRASSRGREMAVRTALGAGRGRLVANAVTESVVLALLGGAFGLLLADMGVSAISALAPADLPVGAPDLDATAYAFALLVSLVSGAVFGIAPALRGTGRDVMATLRESGATTALGRAGMRRAIVAGEIAVATVLLLGSGLFLRSLAAVTAEDPGFEPAGVLVGDVRPSPDRYRSGATRAELYARLVDRLGDEPGVTRAGAISHLPMGGRAESFRFLVEGRDAASFADLDLAEIRSVGGDYFAVLGIGVVEGRALGRDDRSETEPVAAVNRTMARRFWPDGGALGARVSISGPDGPWLRVVGVVDDVRHFGLATAPRPELYLPMGQEPWPAMTLVALVEGDPAARVASLRAVVAEVDPLLPVDAIGPLDELVERSRAPWTLQAVLVGAFAAIAGLLAAAGTYGLLSLRVEERTGEVAVRRALGAGTDDVRRLVGRDVIGLAGAGIAIGLAAGALLTRLVREMVYGVGTLDPLTYLATAALLAVVAAAAAWLPTRRAVAVDPADALRRP